MIRALIAIVMLTLCASVHAYASQKIVECSLKPQSHSDVDVPNTLALQFVPGGDTISLSIGMEKVDLSFFTDDDPEFYFQGETQTTDYELILIDKFVQGKLKNSSAELNYKGKKTGSKSKSGFYTCAVNETSG
jgi:hypothetical protein